MIRPQAKRYVAGRGRYSGDITLPRMLHVAFVRSPYAHAKILSINTSRAKSCAGVVAVITAEDLEEICSPMHTVLAHQATHKSVPQYPLAKDKTVWQGEPVVAIVAQDRAIAEDTLDYVEIDWQALPAIADLKSALAKDANIIHEELGDNIAFSLTIGEERNQTQQTECIVERQFSFGRQTGVPLEPRTILADYNPADESLTVQQSHQAPHLMQTLYARHLVIPEAKVRVICPDVGGAFGTKLHCYGDEMAVVAVSKLLGRPIKYAVDRMEAFVADAHAREFIITAKLGTDNKGRLQQMTVSSIGAIGAYSIYPRSSVGDGVQSVVFCGAPYKLQSIHGKLTLVYQNKPPTGVYRGVGQPLACAITEVLVDDCAANLNMDPVAMRRLNYLKKGDYPYTTACGLQLQNTIFT